MSEPRRYESVPLRGKVMTTSVAAWEAYELLKAGAKQEYRFDGDTKTAARNRAAKGAGITAAQAERLWKNWKTMKFPNGDVYRQLRNKYGHLCSWIENAADRMESERREIEEAHEIGTSAPPYLAGVESTARRAAQ